ncbi:MAG: pilus assembly protein PilP [Burkholderiales bacterium]
MIKNIFPILSLFVLAACGSGVNDELRAFVVNADKNAKRSIQPLPPVQAYAPYAYLGFDLPDPFKPRTLTAVKINTGINAPDLNRRKEALEAFPLESLKMVGTLQQQKETFGLLKADATVFRVKVGNYVGQNFGRVTEITDTAINVKEKIQDGTGDWTERDSSLKLLEEQEKKK